MTHRGISHLVVFVAALAIAVGAGTVAGQSAPDCSTITYDGEGTMENPYEVGNVDQLQCIRSMSLDSRYILISDIDASVTANWNSDETYFNGFREIGPEFSGTFDGDGHTITGLTMDATPIYSGNDVGLFGELASGSKIKNVNLENVDISGDFRVGGVAGSSSGAIVQSSVNGEVNGGEDVGGLVGENKLGGKVSRSSSDVDVSGKEKVGGLVGTNIDTVEYSYATGNVEDGGSVGGPTDSVGGLVGQASSGAVIRESYAAGEVSSDGNAGGVLGYRYSGFPGKSVFGSYWDKQATTQETSTETPDENGLTTSEMTGDDAVQNMVAFDFTETWETVSGDYPVLAWELEDSDKGGSGDDGGESLLSENPFGNANNEPIGELTAIQALISWNNNGEIDGQSYGELELIQYLVEWNGAR